ncbi:MAG: zinc metallopeptidase [Christensenellales bacterium]|jgi:Zn-dependent membrane protease YugP
MFYDSTMLLLLPALLLALLAQSWMKSAYNKYSKIRTQAGIPASQAVQKILYDNGNYEVSVIPTQGTLTDHYDPRKEVLSLSEGVYDSASVAALGIAAHEAGHAMQKKDGYAALSLRTLAVPAVNFGSALSMPIFILGLVMSWQPLLTVGIALFALTVLFSLITLPVEFNASRRAIQMLNASGLITREEEAGVRKVLTAAAMTYVASAIGALLQLFRLILLSKGASRRRD